MAGRIEKTLLGKGGVQGLTTRRTGTASRCFMLLMSSERIAQLIETAAGEWRSFARKWARTKQLVLYEELHELLTRAACSWAGVPLAESEVASRTREITALFDYAGAIGPKHWWARIARQRANSWIEQIIRKIRAGQLRPAEQTPAAIIAYHREPSGDLLSSRVAGVEFLNVIRPIVAVSVNITFVAHALHQYRDVRHKLNIDDDPEYKTHFVQEVRRFYPFFPAAAARVRDDFEWRGFQFPGGRRVLLDLYGTNHDVRTWDAPTEFRPERFRKWNGSPFNFLPQGGGDHYVNHRCPGEWIVIELMKLATEFFTRRIAYQVPEQDLSIDLSRLPALPRSRFVISNVRFRS